MCFIQVTFSDNSSSDKHWDVSIFLSCPGGTLLINGLMGMCRWMGSHFHDRTDYNGAAFSSIFYRVTRMGSHFCGILRVRKIWQVVIYKRKDSLKKNVTVFIAVI